MDRRQRTRQHWLETLARHRHDFSGPVCRAYWSRRLDTASRDELTAIQNDKLRALTPFLFENSAFYRRRFERLGMLPSDLQSVEDLPKWPVVDKQEMARDAEQHPPWGSYTTHDDALWSQRGWMLFSTSGSTAAPRVFRYSHLDRSYWEWANARALHAMGIGQRDTVLPMGGFGPHVFIWGAMAAFAHMGIAVIPGGGLNAAARAALIERYRPTVIACTPSYALHLGRTMSGLGLEPAASSVRTVFIGGEPAMGIEGTRRRLETLWGARVVEFYGCTEASPHAGGFSCPHASPHDGPAFTHLLEDIQIWELVDADSREPVGEGARGLTVCTSLNSESSPQLRFLVGDFTRFDTRVCECGRCHVRALGAMSGRADDLINLRGIKFSPSQIEQAVRSVPGTGDEFEIVLSTNAEGLDVMRVRLEHADPQVAAAIAGQIEGAIRSACEVRATAEVLPPGTLPETEFKAKRVRDERRE